MRIVCIALPFFFMELYGLSSILLGTCYDGGKGEGEEFYNGRLCLVCTVVVGTSSSSSSSIIS